MVRSSWPSGIPVNSAMSDSLSYTAIRSMASAGRFCIATVGSSPKNSLPSTRILATASPCAVTEPSASTSTPGRRRSSSSTVALGGGWKRAHVVAEGVAAVHEGNVFHADHHGVDLQCRHRQRHAPDVHVRVGEVEVAPQGAVADERDLEDVVAPGEAVDGEAAIVRAQCVPDQHGVRPRERHHHGVAQPRAGRVGDDAPDLECRRRLRERGREARRREVSGHGLGGGARRRGGYRRGHQLRGHRHREDAQNSAHDGEPAWNAASDGESAPHFHSCAHYHPDQGTWRRPA